MLKNNLFVQPSPLTGLNLASGSCFSYRAISYRFRTKTSFYNIILFSAVYTLDTCYPQEWNFPHLWWIFWQNFIDLIWNKTGKSMFCSCWKYRQYFCEKILQPPSWILWRLLSICQDSFVCLLVFVKTQVYLRKL